jgi:hypothetical protein
MPLVLIGRLQHARFSGLRIDGGSHAIGSLNLGANYPLDFTDCTLGGNEAAIQLTIPIASFIRCEFSRSGRYALMFTGGALTFQDCRVWAGGRCPDAVLYYKTANDGNGPVFDGFIVDWERPVPRCFARIESLTWNAATYQTKALLRNVLAAFSDVGVDLYSPRGGISPQALGGFLSFEGLELSGPGPIIRTDGPYWLLAGVKEWPENQQGPVCTDGPLNSVILEP